MRPLTDDMIGDVCVHMLCVTPKDFSMTICHVSKKISIVNNNNRSIFCVIDFHCPVKSDETFIVISQN